MRRRGLVQLPEQAQQREEEEVKARRQAAAEGRAVARQRASEQARGQWVKAQRSGARARASRREELRRAAFGGESLFAAAVPCEPARGRGEVTAASSVRVPGFEGAVGGASWEGVWALPRVGLRNLGDTCFASSVAQVLLRTPAILEWVETHHGAAGCRRMRVANDCAACAPCRTGRQVRDARAPRAVAMPVLPAQAGST